MSQLFIKTAHIGLWAIVLIFLVSEIKLNNNVIDENFFHGDYSLQATGNLNQKLVGVVNFETAIETANNGDTFSVLKLNLGNTEEELNHSMEFLIAKENRTKHISKGTYQVLRDVDGFLNYFDGVFGFANIDTLGELPFFAKSGEIRIESIDQDELVGTLRLLLKNTNGKSIRLKGNFVATNEARDFVLN